MKFNSPKRKVFLVLILIIFTVILTSCTGENNLGIPGVSLNVEPTDEPQRVTTGVQLLFLLTILSLAPSVLLMATSFTRIVIVLSMMRSAIGTPTVPPNQVLLGLALILTFFIMSPVYAQIDEQAIQPFVNEEINQGEAIDRAIIPVREFMFKQVREKDIELFLEISGSPRPQTLDDIPTSILLPAFTISELRTAFAMAFVIYIPFLIIDMVIASVLLSMGMMMLPPSLISMPFKILLFVMVDGWYLIVRSLTLSFFQ